MDRRGFLKALGIGGAASAVPVAAAYAMRPEAEPKIPPEESVATLRLCAKERSVAINVGEDGRLWVKGKDDKWKRLAVED